MLKKLIEYQKKLKKWQNKKLQETENEIRSFYKKLVKDVLKEVGTIYANYETNGVLTLAEMAKYDRLRKFLDSLIVHISKMSRTTQESIESVLMDSYEYSYYWMAWAIENSALRKVNYTPLTPEIIDKAINNPVRGLTLAETLEKNRRDIIYQINQNVVRGLNNGLTYKQMADELKGFINNDYEKAVRIVRTETHRVNEQAALDSMQRAHSKGIKSTKQWNCSLDSRVRKTPKANHRVLHGQVVPVDEDFDLKRNGEKGKAPGNTGYAHHDINCRCFLVYDVVAIEGPTDEELANITFEDWKKSLENSQNTRYNSDEEIKQDQEYVNEKLKSGEWGSTINPEKQAPHIESTRTEGKSYFFDHVDVQALFDKYAGTGILEKENSGKRSNKEIVRLDEKENIGLVISLKGVKQANAIKIHHSKKRTHIVPHFEGEKE